MKAPFMAVPGHLAPAFWKVLDSALLSIMLMIGALLGGAVTPFQSVFIINALTAAIAVIAFSKGQWSRIRPRYWALHVKRGILGVVSTVCLFYALRHLDLAEITAIGFLHPALTSLMSAWLLGESFRRLDMVVLVASLAGVGLMLLPSIQLNHLAGARNAMIGVGLAMGSVTALVAYNLNLKVIGEKETVLAQMVWGPVASAVLLMPAAVLLWATVPVQSLAAIVVYAALLVVKLAARYWAFRGARLTAIMPLEYSQLIFSAILGYLFLGESIHLVSGLGMVLLVATNALHITKFCRRPASAL